MVGVGGGSVEEASLMTRMGASGGDATSHTPPTPPSLTSPHMEGVEWG